MTTSNFVITVIGLITTSLLINHFDKKNKERFAGLNYPMSTKVNRELYMGNDKNYSVSGNIQTALPPRFSNVNYGPNIRYNAPDKQHLAMDTDSLPDILQGENVIPVGKRMANDTLDEQDDFSTRSNVEPIVYDRHIYTSAKSNLKRASDPIRGDLAIVPVLPQSNKRSGVMFRPSVSPHVDLGQGYMSSIANNDTEQTSNNLRSLMDASASGNLENYSRSNGQVRFSGFD